VLVLVLELVVVAGAVVVVAGGAVVGGAGPSTVKLVDASSPLELWARMMAAPTTEHWVVRVAVHAGGTWSAPENVAAPLESAVPRVVTLAPWMKSMVMQGTDWSLVGSQSAKPVNVNVKVLVGTPWLGLAEMAAAA